MTSHERQDDFAPPDIHIMVSPLGTRRQVATQPERLANKADRLREAGPELLGRFQMLISCLHEEFGDDTFESHVALVARIEGVDKCDTERWAKFDISKAEW